MPRALLVLCCAALASGPLTAPVAAAGPPPYRPPVDAPVLDPFRPPTNPYGPGNRGLEYATAPGTTVRAVADGQVTFAGAVAGTLHVTLLHPDGVRSTYSFLAEVTVVAGQRVRQGDVVGTTVGALHLGARRGDTYFDPASLFATGTVHVRLVPFDDPLASGDRGERSAIRQLLGGVGDVVDGLGGTAGAVGLWLRGDGGTLMAVTAHYAARFTSPAATLDASLTTWRAWQQARRASTRPCTPDSMVVPTPPGRRVAVLVAGLGSHSRSSAVDEVRTGQLGYAAGDVVRFSYAGGRVPDASDGFADIPAHEYDAADTQTDLRLAASRLADLVDAVVARAPGTPIDLVAHSQGGVVVRLALVELERRHGGHWLARLGLVATLGSPHGGADLATAVGGLSSTGRGAAGLDLVQAVTHQRLDHEGLSVAQLAETSDLVRELAAHEVPETVDAVSIAARGDVIVPVPRTAAPGMDQVVLPMSGLGAHADLPGSEGATRALRLALAGRPPACQSFAAALADQAVGESISLLEDVAGALTLSAAVGADVRAS